MTQDHTTEKPNACADCDRIVAKLAGRPIVLIGMMGSGKSRTAHALSAALDLGVVDSDREIEVAAGCSIADYFSRHGEETFRDGEARVLTRLLDAGDAKVIATGGGIVLRDENRQALRDRAITVWLQADVKVLAARCAGTTKRPLLNTGDPEEILTDLLAKRAALYEDAATFVVRSDQPDVNDTVKELLDGLRHCLKVDAS